MDVNVLRQQVHRFLASGQYQNAVFFSEKLLTLTRESADILLHARALHAFGDHVRCVQLLRCNDLPFLNCSARLLCAKSLLAMRDFTSALQLLGDSSSVDAQLTSDGAMLSQLFVCRAQLYEAMEDTSNTEYWYAEALKYDPWNHEAMFAMQTLGCCSADKEVDHLGMLDPSLRMLYGLHSHVSAVRDASVESCTSAGLAANEEVQIAVARKLEEQRQFDRALAVLTSSPRVLHHPLSQPLYVSLLFTLSKTQELYLLASSSTSAAASGGSLPFGAPATQGANSSGASAEFAAAAWTSGESAYAMTRFGSLQREAFSCYVAGVYYLSQRQLDKARRWLQRALLRQPRLVEAHIAMGHAYALEDESDQAVAAYRQAGRLAPNAHLPLVFLAQEYMATENWVLADAALVDATARNSADAGVWNEYGVLKAKRGQLDVAVMHFERAVSLCSDAPEFVLNLAHAKRRLGDLEAAVSLYETCIALRPHDAEIQFALGIALHMLGDVDRAVVAYHKAQALNPQHEHAALAKFFRLAMEDAASLPVNFDKFDAHD